MSSSAANLLAEREQRLLLWVTRIRIAFGVFLIVLIPLIAGRRSEAITIGALVLIFTLTHTLFLYRLNTGGEAARISKAGAIIDALMLCTLPVIWHLIYSVDGEPLLHLSRHNLGAVSFVLIAANGLVLRPLNPAVLTVTAVLLHISLALIGLFDPRSGISEETIQAALVVGMSASDLMYVTPVLIAIAGTFVTLAAYAARGTVYDAVHREHDAAQLRQQQLSLVLEAKMAAVGDLVAGVEHEVNNPLGALRSATDTGARALTQVREELSTEGGPQSVSLERNLNTLATTQALAGDASSRLLKVMQSIRSFVQLDRAEIQRIDLADLIRTVVNRSKNRLRADTSISVYTPEGILAEVDPRRIVEALTTVVCNAAESFDAPGALTISLKSVDDEVIIEVVDTGRGMATEVVDGLFDIDFAHGERTHARFGLALCRSIMQRHGGAISISSEPGLGTTVVLCLPIDGDAR